MSGTQMTDEWIFLVLAAVSALLWALWLVFVI